MTFHKRTMIAVSGLVAAALCLGAGQSKSYSAREVQAAFLVKFTYFVDWPDDAFEDKNDPIVIVILGDDPFGETLDQMAKDRTVGGRRIVIERKTNLDGDGPCHVIYISASERSRISSLVNDLEETCMLTVSDIPGFCAKGGMLEFSIKENKVSILGNFKAAAKAGVKLSSKLMQVVKKRVEGSAMKGQDNAHAA